MKKFKFDYNNCCILQKMQQSGPFWMKTWLAMRLLGTGMFVKIAKNRDIPEKSVPIIFRIRG